MPESISRDIYSNDLEYLELIDLKSNYPHNWDSERLRQHELVIARIFHPIGFAAYKPPTTRRLMLLRLAVLPRYREQGVATRILDEVIRITGCTKITMVLRESNDLGHKVLAHLGFKAVSTIRQRFDGEDGYYFVRTL